MKTKLKKRDAREKKLVDSFNRYTKNICDKVANQYADVETATVAADLVRHTIRELFRHEFPDTKWVNGGLVAISNDVGEGSAEYSFNEIIRSGRAAKIGPNATDVPNADIEGRRTIRPVHGFGVKIQYTTRDIRRARKQGLFSVAEEKAAAAREAHDRTMDDLIRSGEGESDLYGMTNHPGIQVENAGTGNWATATPEQIVEDHRLAINSMMTDSDGVVNPNTIVYDIESFTRISTLQNSTASDITVLQFLKQAFPNITQWTWEYGMKSVGADGGPAALIYRKDRTRQRVVMPMALKALPPQPKGYGFDIYFESEFGGVMMPKPKDVKRWDGIGAPVP